MATKRAECTFVVKDGGNNRPLIQIEPTIVGDAPDFVEVGEAGIAVGDAMRRGRCVQLVG
jgi:hypothetical protein